jgi:hypothetical protein
MRRVLQRKKSRGFVQIPGGNHLQKNSEHLIPHEESKKIAKALKDELTKSLHPRQSLAQQLS